MRYAISLSAWALYMLMLTADPSAPLLARPQQFTTTIFVCALDIAPDRCDADTAVDKTAGPNVDNEIMCGKLSQATIASTALAPRDGLEYMMIRCQRPDLK